MSYKGKFRPKNPKKYKGDPTIIIYRSLLERRFMVYCDDTSAIIKWASEEIIIPYVNPITGRVHRYFPDFYIKYKNKKNEIVEELIEIKPHKQTKPPDPKKQRQVVNQKDILQKLETILRMRRNGDKHNNIVLIENGIGEF